MSNFWPLDLNLTDCVTPRDILSEAQNEWGREGKGIFELVFRNTKSETGNELVIVYAQHRQSRKTAKLFQVLHRPDKPFPVTIQPEIEALPEVFQREYKKTVSSGFSSIAHLMNPQERIINVTNDWVATTPAEFRENLSRAFQSDSVRSQLLNMLVTSPPLDATSSSDNETSVPTP